MVLWSAAVKTAYWVKFHTEGKMNLKQKKEYMAPEMEVVEMGYENHLLQNSEIKFGTSDDNSPPSYGDGTGTGEVG